MKYLPQDKALLRDNSIKIGSKEKIEDENNVLWELSNVNIVQPNRRFLGVPLRLWLYNKSTRGDTTVFKNWVRRSLGEPPAILDSARTQASADAMENYMHNKGWFNATVTHETKIKNRKANVAYSIFPNGLYAIDSVNYNIEDENIKKLILNSKKESYLKKGKGISRQTFDLEKNRIVRELKNHGYYYFYPNYVYFEGDSTARSVDVTVNIANPDEGQHEPYTIGSIYVHTQYNPAAYLRQTLDTTLLNDLYFIHKKEPDKLTIGEEDLGVDPTTILRAIRIKRHNKYYRIKEFDRTIFRLNNLAIYKFVSIKYVENKRLGNVLDVVIQLTPGKKMSIGGDLEVSSVQNSVQSRGIGIGLGATYKNKNLLKGAEVFSVSPNLGFEYDFIQQNFTTFDFGVETGVTFPQYFPLPWWVKPDHTTRRGLEKTKVSLAYDYLSRFQFYTYSSLSTSYGIEWTEFYVPNKHNIKFLTISYLNPISIDSSFQVILDRNQLLKNSFERQFIISPSYSLTFTGKPKPNGISFYANIEAEAAGTLVRGIDFIFNREKPFQLPGGTPYANFAKIELDGRFYKMFSRRHNFAARAAIGAGAAYWNSQAIPYVRQFFIGGPNSVRGWRVRDIGPGTYVDKDLRCQENYQPYQTGDLKLELSAEYRFLVYYYMEGALFLDAGNVWTIREDVNRPGSQISGRFLNELAVAAGYGVRFNFSFFVFRLDWGYPIRELRSYEDGGPYWKYRKAEDFVGFHLGKSAEWNFAINYPF